MVQTTFRTAVSPESTEPLAYAIARSLQRLGEAIASAGTAPVGMHATVQYSHGQTGEVGHVAAQVHALPPERRQVAGGWHYNTEIDAAGLRMLVFCGIDEPPEAKRERLVRELAELDAQSEPDILAPAAPRDAADPPGPLTAEQAPVPGEPLCSCTSLPAHHRDGAPGCRYESAP